MRGARPLLLAVLSLALLAPAAAAQDLPDLDDPTTPAGGSIKTTGEASIAARPDTARVTFGMTSRRRTGPAAVAASGRKARRVIARLRAAGVEAADIRELDVRLTRFRRNRRVHHAVARNSIRVTIRDVGRVRALIAAARAAGATSVGTPGFSLSDPKDLYERALLAAFDDAEEKAQALADRAGVTLGLPTEISEGERTNENGRVGATITVVFALQEF